ncbi:MAG: hypothetical protein LBR08_04850, partial [Bacteroidales bacterium]|nr:hypothetical protein [Bacteroidales bacterium]
MKNISVLTIAGLFFLYSCPHVKKQQENTVVTQQTPAETEGDSARWAREKREETALFYSFPPIAPEEVSAFQPVIRKWLDYYQIDLSQARLVQRDTTCFNCPPDTSSLYHLEFDEEDMSTANISRDYSPNSQFDVSLGIQY